MFPTVTRYEIVIPALDLFGIVCLAYYSTRPCGVQIQGLCLDQVLKASFYDARVGNGHHASMSLTRIFVIGKLMSFRIAAR